jgi:CheY-like chemotaxis protein
MSAAAPLILLVDDDEDFLAVNRRVLEAEGYRVTCATEPQDAWAAVAAEKPDLVITDLMMSNLDSGFSLARQIKQDPRSKDIPVIIATAVSSQLGHDFRPRTPADLAAMHADAYFDKPIPPQALVEKAAELLARQR